VAIAASRIPPVVVPGGPIVRLPLERSLRHAIVAAEAIAVRLLTRRPILASEPIARCGSRRRLTIAQRLAALFVLESLPAPCLVLRPFRVLEFLPRIAVLAAGAPVAASHLSRGGGGARLARLGR
jgi:hypothetical protein